MATRLELIARAEERCAKTKETIEKLPDNLKIDYQSIEESTILMKTVYEGDAEEKLGMLHHDLHKLRENLGNYKLDGYHMLWSSTLSVSYRFDKIRIHFYFYKDCGEILEKISGGKCHIEKVERNETESKIICSV